MSYTESRARYAEMLDGVINDREEVVITRAGHEPVVVVSRINALLADIQRNGNDGIGKPEALKHDFAGHWSRRITDEHRLVYKLAADQVRIAACRYHYG